MTYLLIRGNDITLENEERILLLLEAFPILGFAKDDGREYVVVGEPRCLTHLDLSPWKRLELLDDALHKLKVRTMDKENRPRLYKKWSTVYGKERQETVTV